MLILTLVSATQEYASQMAARPGKWEGILMTDIKRAARTRVETKI